MFSMFDDVSLKKKEQPLEAFYKYCEIFSNIFFTELLRGTAFEETPVLHDAF